MSDDASSIIRVHDADELRLAVAEVKRRTLTLIARRVVGALDDLGIARDEIVSTATPLVLRGYTTMCARYDAEAAQFEREFAEAAQQRAENDDEPQGSPPTH